MNYQPGPPETRTPPVSRTGQLLSDLAVGADRGFDIGHDDQADASDQQQGGGSGHTR